MSSIERGKALSKELRLARSNVTRKNNAYIMARGTERTMDYSNKSEEEAQRIRKQLRDKTTKAHEELLKAQERRRKIEAKIERERRKALKSLGNSPTF